MYVTTYKTTLGLSKEMKFIHFPNNFTLFNQKQNRQSTLPGKEESNYIFGEINKMGKSPQYLNT